MRSYTAETPNTQDTVEAQPADAQSQVSIQINGAAHTNGTAASWNDGDNAVAIAVRNGNEAADYAVKVAKQAEPEPDLTLSALSIGTLTLTPLFDPDTLQYTADTTNNTNSISATASDAQATVSIEVNSAEHANGTAATWENGPNTVEITVRNLDRSQTYAVTVTKS